MESPMSFAELMRLEKIDENTFRSTVNAYQPGGHLAKASGIRPLAYGGHVFAQSMLAAAQTIPLELICHSVNGHFLQAANSELPFLYNVRSLRDGKNFCLRAVDVTQKGTNITCFTSLCSFKRSEDKKLEFQPMLDVQKQFRTVLGDKLPGDHPEPLSAETPWFKKSRGSYNGPPFPGLKSRMVNMDEYNRGLQPIHRRQLHLYSVIGDLPDVREAPNLHAAAHLYASDRNGLYILSRMLEIDNYYGLTASLSHTVILHSLTESLSMANLDGAPKWFTQEVWTDRLADSRGLLHSRLWDSKDRLIATTIQDGLIRLDIANEDEQRILKDALSRSGRL